MECGNIYFAERYSEEKLPQSPWYKALINYRQKTENYI